MSTKLVAFIFRIYLIFHFIVSIKSVLLMLLLFLETVILFFPIKFFNLLLFIFRVGKKILWNLIQYLIKVT